MPCQAIWLDVPWWFTFASGLDFWFFNLLGVPEVRDVKYREDSSPVLFGHFLEWAMGLSQADSLNRIQGGAAFCLFGT